MPRLAYLPEGMYVNLKNKENAYMYVKKMSVYVF